MIYFLIPVYNETANLELLSSNLSSVLPGKKRFYVFVDDGSSDGTPEKIKSCFNNTEVIVLGDGKNHGPGFSFNLGFEWILKQETGSDTRIITIEGDNTSDLAILPQMFGISEMGFNLVLASVYVQGGGFDKTNFIRRLISSVANLFLRFFFNIKVQTLSSFFRVYTIGLLRNIKTKYGTVIEQSGFLCMIEILLKAIRLKASIIEVPMILYSKRRHGKSKMKVLNTSLSYLKFLFTNKIK